MTDTITVQVPATDMKVESRGATVSIETGNIPHNMLVQFVLHGIRQRLLDAANPAARVAYHAAKGEAAPAPSRDQLKDWTEANAKSVASVTEGLMLKARDAILAGEWTVRQGSGTKTTISDLDKAIFDLAKDEIYGRLKAYSQKHGRKGLLADFEEIPAASKYMTFGSGQPQWNVQAILEWSREPAQEKFDFAARAQAIVAAQQGIADTLDGEDDLLADL